MELTLQQNRQIKAIMAGMVCPKGFRCYVSKFEDLTPAEAFKGDNIVECLGDASSCLMAFSFGMGRGFCMCPLCRYIAQYLGNSTND